MGGDNDLTMRHRITGVVGSVLSRDQEYGCSLNSDEGQSAIACVSCYLDDLRRGAQPILIELLYQSACWNYAATASTALSDGGTGSPSFCSGR